MTACGSAASNPGSGSDSGSQAAAGTCPKPCVQMKDVSFQPTNITVRVGQRVTWLNTDPVSHDVVAVPGGPGPKSALLAQGRSYSFTPTRAGTISYVCTVHPSMKATLTVR